MHSKTPREIEAPFKFICLLGLLVFVSIAGQVDGAGECGKSSPENEAMKLAPCAAAAQDDKLPCQRVAAFRSRE